jgi:hypothetical protein
MRPVLRILSVTVLALAAGACATATPTAPPTASVVPTATPTASPSATPTNPPTVGPSVAPGSQSTPPTETPGVTAAVEPTPTSLPSGTPTVAPTLTAPPTSAPPVPTPGAIDHPTDASAVILRDEQQGGFVRPGTTFARVPGFSLFGDGTVIYRPLDPNATLGETLPQLAVTHMDEDQIQALLRFAIGTGRLENARSEYLSPGIADAPSTVFTLNAGQLSKKVTVAALGNDQVPPADAADIAGFQRLDALLSDFGKQVGSGQATDGGLLTPTAYLGQLFPADGLQGARAWPWPEIKQTDLTATPDGNGVFLVRLTPDQASKVTTVPTGGALNIPLNGPDKKGYTLSIRPALPDDAPPTGG